MNLKLLLKRAVTLDYISKCFSLNINAGQKVMNAHGNLWADCLVKAEQYICLRLSNTLAFRLLGVLMGKTMNAC